MTVDHGGQKTAMEKRLRFFLAVFSTSDCYGFE